jgi:cell shape-determining protein MreD
MPFRRIMVQTVAFGLVMALAALLFKRWDFSIGAVVGALVSCAGLLHMKSTLRKMLTQQETKSPTSFYFSSAIRLLVWAVVLFLLVKISLACLLGAVASYVAFMSSLALNGLKRAAEEGKDEDDPSPDEERP